MTSEQGTLKLVWWRILRWLGRLGFYLIFRAEVRGLEYAKKSPPGTVVVANHLSYLDAAALAVFLPFPVTFAINPEVAQKPWVRVWLGIFRAIPVSREDPSALRKLIRLVGGGNHLMLFPEGRISLNGGLMRIFGGPMALARKGSGCLLPVVVGGVEDSAYALGVRRRRWNWFPKLKLRVRPSVLVPSQVGEEWVYDILLEGLIEMRVDENANEKAGELDHYLAAFLTVYPREEGAPIASYGLGEGSLAERLVEKVAGHRSTRWVNFSGGFNSRRMGRQAYDLQPKDLWMDSGMVESFVRGQDPRDWNALERCFVVGPLGSIEADRLGARFGIKVHFLEADPESWRDFLSDPWIKGRLVGSTLVQAAGVELDRDEGFDQARGR
ncbi:MAG: 1-acyl-sn-glycerol-3-phosphate acyltransferase [Puniceicoccaceae bacterium]